MVVDGLEDDDVVRPQLASAAANRSKAVGDRPAYRWRRQAPRGRQPDSSLGQRVGPSRITDLGQRRVVDVGTHVRLGPEARPDLAAGVRAQLSSRPVWSRLPIAFIHLSSSSVAA